MRSARRRSNGPLQALQFPLLNVQLMIGLRKDQENLLYRTQLLQLTTTPFSSVTNENHPRLSDPSITQDDNEILPVPTENVLHRLSELAIRMSLEYESHSLHNRRVAPR